MLGPAVLNRVQPFINEFFPDPESENVLAVETGSRASSISGSRATVSTVDSLGDDQVQEQAAPAASESVEAVDETFEDASEDLDGLLNMDT